MPLRFSSNGKALANPAAVTPGIAASLSRIGAGDSFVAGLLHGILDGDLDLAIRLAAYAAAIALATPGDINYFAAEDLAAFYAGAVGGLVR